MANVQFISSSFTSRKFIGKIQTAESIRISVKQDISDIVSVGIENCINSYESTVGEASFYGKTNIRLLYGDGTNLCSSSHNADFTASIQSELLTAESKLTFDVVTVDSKVETNANTATITILLEVSVYAYVEQSTPYFADGEDIFVNRQAVEVLERANVIRLPFVLDEELTASRNISTVLLAECSLCAKDSSVHDGVLQISGSGSARLTYLSNGEIVTDTLPFDFDRELEVDDDMAECQLRLNLCPKTTKVRLDITEGDVNTTFTMEIGAVAVIEATKIGVMDIVTDAYGSGCDFDFTRRTVNTTIPCGSTVCRKTTTATLPTEQDKRPLTAVNVGAIVTSAQSREKSAQVDGVVYATLLYATESGYVGEQLELPFSQVVDVDYLMPQCKSHARVTVMGITVADDVALDLCITVDAERDVSYTVIVDAEEQPFDKDQLPAIEVCLAHKGETLWSLAKSLHMSQEDLLSTNPQITNPLEQDARIVVFNHI